MVTIGPKLNTQRKMPNTRKAKSRLPAAKRLSLCQADTGAMRSAGTELRQRNVLETHKPMTVHPRGDINRFQIHQLFLEQSLPLDRLTFGLNTCVQGYLKTELEDRRKFCFTVCRVCPEAPEFTIQSPQCNGVINNTAVYSIFSPPVSLVGNKERVCFSRLRSRSVSGCSWAVK